MPIKKIVAPVTAEGMQDTISRTESGDAVTVPGRIKDWLNPRPKGKSPLDPVLLAARKADDKKKKGAYKRKPVDPTSVETGHDGLPRPGRK